MLKIMPQMSRKFRARARLAAPICVMAPALLMPGWVTRSAFIIAGGIFYGLQTTQGNTLENHLAVRVREKVGGWWRGKGKVKDEIRHYTIHAKGRWLYMYARPPRGGKINQQVGVHIAELIDEYQTKGRHLIVARRFQKYFTRVGVRGDLWHVTSSKNRYSRLLMCGDAIDLAPGGIRPMPCLDRSDFAASRIVLGHPTHALNTGDVDKHDQYYRALVGRGRPVRYRPYVDDEGPHPGWVEISPLPQTPEVLILEEVLKHHTRPSPLHMLWAWNLVSGLPDWFTLEEFLHLLLMGITGSGKSVLLHQLVAQFIKHPQISEIIALDVAKNGATFSRYGDSRKIKVAADYAEARAMVLHLRNSIMVYRFKRLKELGEAAFDKDYANQHIVFLCDEYAVLHNWRPPRPPTDLPNDRAVKQWIAARWAEHREFITALEEIGTLGREIKLHGIIAGQKLTTENMDSSIRTQYEKWKGTGEIDRYTAEGMFGKQAKLLLDPTTELRVGQMIDQRRTLIEYHQSAVPYRLAREKGLL